MTKNSETRRHLRYDRRKDANVNNFLDNDGTYVITRDVMVDKHWEKQVVARFNPDDFPNGAEIILALSDLDYQEDVQEEGLNEHIDKVFQKRLTQYEGAPDSSDMPDPWDQVTYANGETDILDQLFLDEVPEDEKMEKLSEFIQTLQPQQVDLLYQHLGARRSLEDLRLEEIEQTGKPISQQAYSCRWNKILDRACKFLGVEKPRKRKAGT